MAAAILTRANAVRPKPPARPEKPAQQLWKTDKAKAFEAGLRWFLAVSRNA
ncbi:unnamed protein product [Gemmataceae bacterium]|nr:unnamed protein product [Gemmataceae bacterium]VTT98850.1 unnamed protein product [Gemmataceae bacterium]